jgi:hypothetical protein
MGGASDTYFGLQVNAMLRFLSQYIISVKQVPSPLHFLLRFASIYFELFTISASSLLVVFDTSSSRRHIHPASQQVWS